MKQLLRTVAVLISLLSPTFVYIAPIEANGNEDYLDSCAINKQTLKFVRLGRINDSYISSAIIKCLTIEESGIVSAADGAFDKLPNLWYLNLQGNNICPSDLFSFGNLSTVRKLILGNQIFSSYDIIMDPTTDSRNPREWYNTAYLCGTWKQRIVQVQGIYPQLRYLDLQSNGILGLQSPWKNPFPELTYLDLSGNRIRDFSVMRLWASKLTHLYLNYTGILQFSLEGYSDLTTLVLDNNEIKTIGGNGLDVFGATNLTNLSLVNNDIYSIREGAFSDTVSLEYLDISMNLLSTIYPGTLEDLHSLQVLVLDQNFFEDLSIAFPRNITVLSVNCNRIKFLTISSLYNLRQLKTLSLTGNKIMIVHTDAFRNQEMLEELYLNNNELSYLPNGWYKTMKVLRYLDLSNNEFILLESVFQTNLPSLEQLYFERNPIKYIKASTLGTFSKNVTVYLDCQSKRTTVMCQAREPSPSYQTTTTTRSIKTTTPDYSSYYV